MHSTPLENDENEPTDSLLHRDSYKRETAANFQDVRPPPSYNRVHIPIDTKASSHSHALENLRLAISLREKWLFAREVPQWYDYPPPHKSEYSVFVPPPYDPFDEAVPESSEHVCQWHSGLVSVYADGKDVMRRNSLYKSGSFASFAEDLAQLMSIVNDPETRSFCYKRLMLLQEQFNMYLILNEENERLAQIAVPHRDFYNVRKVDTHVHHSSLANQKHLLRFIKRKVRENGDQPVLANRDDPSKPPLTLNQVFQSLNLTPYDLSVDTLDVHADKTIFHRFDRFNLKYNPFGQSRLREIFMKTDNFIKGTFLAELTMEVLKELEETKYQNSEYRISIYGRDPMEWDKLGKWFQNNKVYSDNVRWLIQIPRLYSSYKLNKRVNSFQDMLDNIFNPIFEATIDPGAHPEVHRLLQQVVGFDSVDDESQPQPPVNLANCGPPETWDGADNPPYSYYSFYISSNLAVLNKLREAKGLNTLSYRPHAGEAGDITNLGTGFLLAHGINHGLNLKKSPVLQYLYILTQIGVAMSPLSNNALFCEYTKNPLPTYFKRGLNVTLSTDDPLQFAFTREPLMEEYSVAAQVWKLSNTDLCELARNSVLQSGFEECIKAQWLGNHWYRPGHDGNDIEKTNVPDIRLMYRHDTLLDELKLIYEGNVPDKMHVLPTFKFEPHQSSSSEETFAPGFEGKSENGVKA